MNKLILLISAAILSFVALSESRADPVCDCGATTKDNCCWEVKDGTLYVTGSGNMAYYWGKDAPWKEQNDLIDTIDISGISKIGAGAFLSMKATKAKIADSVTTIEHEAFCSSSIKSVNIPSSLTRFGEMPFRDCKSLEEIIVPDTFTAEVMNTLPGTSFTSNGATIRCKGETEKCRTAMKKFLPEPEGDCPATGIWAWVCAKNATFKPVENEAQCTGQYVWENGQCKQMDQKTCNESGKYYYNGSDCTPIIAGQKLKCTNDYVEYQNLCLEEYPFAKKRWTPAEANEWLHDGNDNFVVITFKK